MPPEAIIAASTGSARNGACLSVLLALVAPIVNRFMFPKQLLNGLWHTTNVRRFKKIIEYGAIIPEPDIPDSERWCTGRGRDHYPFVRILGGVSLFDFVNFDPNEYSGKFPMSSWNSFVPTQSNWIKTIWIEINREKVRKHLIEGQELVKKWNDEKMHGHNIMPIIECAYIGELSTDSFLRVLLYDRRSKEFSTIDSY